MRTAAVPTTPEIVGDAHIHSQEIQSLNRAERKSAGGVRGLLVQVRNILREWPLDVFHDRMRDSTTPEAIVDLTDGHAARSDLGQLGRERSPEFGRVVEKWVTPFDEVGLRY